MFIFMFSMFFLIAAAAFGVGYLSGYRHCREDYELAFTANLDELTTE